MTTGQQELAGDSVRPKDAESDQIRFGAEQAEHLWVDLYGSQAQAQEIASELDAIFRMTDAEDGRDYLFRVADNSEGIMDLQAAALTHIAKAAPALPIPHVRNMLSGEVCASVPGGDNNLAAFATSFVNGIPLAKAISLPSAGHQIFEQLALLDQALSSFSHPRAKRTLLWDVSNADQAKQLTDFIPDADVRALVEQALDDWSSGAAPVLPRLRRQVIHNDFNPSNIFVEADDGTIAGIIDFGDIMEAPLVCDLATAIAYQEPVPGFEAMLDGAVTAYDRHFPLTNDEILILPILVRARAAMVVAITHWRASQTPANRDYFLRNAPLASRVLASAAQSRTWAPAIKRETRS